MYTPAAFKSPTHHAAIELIKENSFATLIHTFDRQPMISHLPLIFDPTEQHLIGHLAKANPHSQQLEQGEYTAIFQGAHDVITTNHHFISQIPTWNYAVVHVSGKCQIVHDISQQQSLLAHIHHRFDPNPFDPELFERMWRAVVFFTLSIERVEAKFKLSQNRQPAEIQRTIEAMNILNPALAKLMKQANPNV